MFGWSLRSGTHCTQSLVPPPKESVLVLASTAWCQAVQIPALCHPLFIYIHVSQETELSNNLVYCFDAKFFSPGRFIPDKQSP